MGKVGQANIDSTILFFNSQTLINWTLITIFSIMFSCKNTEYNSIFLKLFEIKVVFLP